MLNPLKQALQFNKDEIITGMALEVTYNDGKTKVFLVRSVSELNLNLFSYNENMNVTVSQVESGAVILKKMVVEQ